MKTVIKLVVGLLTGIVAGLAIAAIISVLFTDISFREFADKMLSADGMETVVADRAEANKIFHALEASKEKYLLQGEVKSDLAIMNWMLKEYNPIQKIEGIWGRESSQIITKESNHKEFGT